MEPCYAMLIPPALGGSGLKNSFLISEKLMNLALLDKVVRECRNDKYYHKVIVFAEEEYRRDFILKTLLNCVEPATFSPVLFKKEESNYCFFVKSCQDVLMKFISAKFTTKIPNEGEKNLKLRIICNFITVEALEVVNTNNLSDVLKRRYEGTTKNLDLSYFCDDESLFEYCPLYLPRNMIAVMAHVSHYHLKGINLQHNHLKDTSSFYSLQKDIESLDLRNNEIQSLEDLACLKRFTKLKSLYLDGNPLCDLYDNFNYVIEIKSLCNSLQFIDGERIESPPKCQKFFLCRLESKEFADQFMKLFFTQYDSDNRPTLKDLYEKNALLTVSATMVPHHNTSKDVNLNHYGLKDPFLVRGVEEIMRLFKELPRTRHYPYQFTCDVTLYERRHAAISISGVFWEHKQFISFVRNFMLIRNGNKFTITNEQLNVTNATNNQIDRSITSRYASNFPYFPSEYGKMEMALGKLTNMNRTMCQKFLYHCQYDLNRALQVFCEAFINDRIPSDVFAADGNISSDDVSSFSELIIKELSKTSQTVTEESVWNVMEMKRLKRCLYQKKVKISSVKKILHMRHKQKSSKQSKPNSNSTSKQSETLEKPKKINKLKPISFKLSVPTVIKNKGTKRKQEKPKEEEEATKGNTKIGNKNGDSKINKTGDKSKPKTLTIRSDIFLKIVDKDAQVESINLPSKKDNRVIVTTLKSKAQGEIPEIDHKSKKIKLTNSDNKKEATNNNIETNNKNKAETVVPLANVAQPSFQEYVQNTTNVSVNPQTVQMPWSNNTTPVVQPYQYLQQATNDQMNPQPYFQHSVQMDPQTLIYNQFQSQFWNAANFQQPMFAQNMFQPYQSAQSPMSQHLLPQETFQGAQSFPAQQPMQLELTHWNPYQFENMTGLTTPQHIGANNINYVAPPGTEDVPGDMLQSRRNENLRPVEISNINQEFHQSKGMDPVEKMLHSVIRQLRTDNNQAVTVKKEISINKCVQKMLSFVKRLETSYKSNGGKRTIEQPVIVQRVIPVTVEEDLAFSIIHVILHEMFEYESCKYDPNTINLNISTKMQLCSNKIYLSRNNQLLCNIREKLYQNQSVFDILRFKTAQSLIDGKDNQFTLPYILRVNNTLDVFYEILKKAIEGNRGPLNDDELVVTKTLAQYVSTYFKDSSNTMAKRRFEFNNIFENRSFQKGMKGVITLTTEALVHIVIHEFIENSTCPNNKSENFLNIPNLPPICHNTIYRPPFKIALDDIRCLLRQAELKQKLLYESKQQENVTLQSDPTNELMKRPVAFTELFIDVLVRICSENSIGNQKTLTNRYNLAFFARTIASLVQHLDNNHSKKINQDLLNGVVRLLDKQETDTHNPTSPKRYLINLSKSIIHVTLHEMFEYLPCTGYVPLPLKLMQVLKSLNENVPVEKLLCRDDIYQLKNQHLRTLIRQCLSEIEHHFKTLKLTSQPFAFTCAIYNLAGTHPAPVEEPAGQYNIQRDLKQRGAEDNLNREKADDSNHKPTEVNKSHDIPIGQIKGSRIEEQVPGDHRSDSTPDVQIIVDDRVHLPINCIKEQAKTHSLKNVVNLENHLLGKNVNKALIIHLLKMISYPIIPWPNANSQTKVKIFDVLAESFILNVQDIIENPTIRKVVSGLETKNVGVDVSSKAEHPIELCGSDSSKAWINNKLREKYDSLIKGMNKLYLLKSYAGLLHVVVHDIIEKSTCDSTNCNRNESGNSNIRSVICSDNTYNFPEKLDIIYRVIHGVEEILQSGNILSNANANVIVLPQKLTFLFGLVPEKSINLEVYLLKNTFVSIVGRLLKKFCHSKSYPHLFKQLDELAEKMTFVMQHYYNISLNKEGFTIGPLDAISRKSASPHLFYLFVGILDVIGNDFTIFKKRLSENALIHPQLSIESRYLPVEENLRRFIRYVLKSSQRLFPSWLEFAYDKLAHFFNETRHGHEDSSMENREELAKIIHVMLPPIPKTAELTPEDSSLIYHFAEKIYYFLKNIKLVNPALPLTETFYECLGMICLPNGPPYAQVITRASQILVHMLTYHFYSMERQLDYQIVRYYRAKDKKMFNRMMLGLELRGENVVTTKRYILALNNGMLKNWEINVPKHLRSTKQPAGAVLSKKQRKRLAIIQKSNVKNLKLCI